jgi:TRAP transporter TAXI family solute receptor
MNPQIPTSILTLLAVLAIVSCGGPADESDSGRSHPGKKVFVAIGTGAQSGVYYPTGVNIAEMINRNPEYGIKATAEPTGGSVYNIDQVIRGGLDFGVAQSDRQYQAYNGLAEWEDKGAQTELRSVFSIHAEAVTLVAADDAGIRSMHDLLGKSVNIGNPGSGQRQNAIDALTSAGIDFETDLLAEQVQAGEAPSLLQDNRIDAFFFTVGHPSGTIIEATAGRRKVRFVPITEVETLLEDHPYYARTTIPVAHYGESMNEQDVDTFGVKATFITRDSVSDDVVYAFAREVFENLEEFKKMHEAYGGLTKQNMLEGLSAPLHPGAARYYEEAGLRAKSQPAAAVSQSN